jgi:hypothetical protein
MEDMSMKKPKKKPKCPKIDPNQIKTRDELMVRLINGATKSGPQEDRRKEASKNACREKVDPDMFEE